MDNALAERPGSTGNVLKKVKFMLALTAALVLSVFFMNSFSIKANAAIKKTWDFTVKDCGSDILVDLSHDIDDHPDKSKHDYFAVADDHFSPDSYKEKDSSDNDKVSRSAAWNKAKEEGLKSGEWEVSKGWPEGGTIKFNKYKAKNKDGTDKKTEAGDQEYNLQISIGHVDVTHTTPNIVIWAQSIGREATGGNLGETVTSPQFYCQNLTDEYGNPHIDLDMKHQVRLFVSTFTDNKDRSDIYFGAGLLHKDVKFKWAPLDKTIRFTTNAKYKVTLNGYRIDKKENEQVTQKQINVKKLRDEDYSWAHLVNYNTWERHKKDRKLPKDLPDPVAANSPSGKIYTFVGWKLTYAKSVKDGKPQTTTVDIKPDGSYPAGFVYPNQVDTLTACFKDKPIGNNKIKATPNDWSAGYGTVTCTAVCQHNHSGIKEVDLYRVNAVTKDKKNVHTWSADKRDFKTLNNPADLTPADGYSKTSYSTGGTQSAKLTYTENDEGKWYYYFKEYDYPYKERIITPKKNTTTTHNKSLEHKSAKSATIYLDHSKPKAVRHNVGLKGNNASGYSTNGWSNGKNQQGSFKGITIAFDLNDHLDNTAFRGTNGSGIAWASITRDDNPQNPVVTAGKGAGSISYTLKDSDEGDRRWTLKVVDNVYSQNKDQSNHILEIKIHTMYRQDKTIRFTTNVSYKVTLEGYQINKGAYLNHYVTQDQIAVSGTQGSWKKLINYAAWLDPKEGSRILPGDLPEPVVNDPTPGIKHEFVGWKLTYATSVKDGVPQTTTVDIKPGGSYPADFVYPHQVDTLTACFKDGSIGNDEIKATPNDWSAGYGTVTCTAVCQHNHSGIKEVDLYRVNPRTSDEKIVRIWSADSGDFEKLNEPECPDPGSVYPGYSRAAYSTGGTQSKTLTYTEKEEGIWGYYFKVTDYPYYEKISAHNGGTTTNLFNNPSYPHFSAASRTIYLDHSKPKAVQLTQKDYAQYYYTDQWSNGVDDKGTYKGITIAFDFNDHLDNKAFPSGTNGSGIAWASITRDDNPQKPVVTAGKWSGSISYTLQNKDEGDRTWTIRIADNVYSQGIDQPNHILEIKVRTRYDITRPYIAPDGNTIKRVRGSVHYDDTDEGEYAEGSRIRQTTDDLAKRSSNFYDYEPTPPGLITSGLKKVTLTTVTQPQPYAKDRTVRERSDFSYHTMTVYKAASSDTNSSYTLDWNCSLKAEQARYGNNTDIVCYYLDVWDWAGNHTKKLILTEDCVKLHEKRVIFSSSYDHH